MIVQNVAVEVDRSAGLMESAFAMDATASAFDILSSGLYSDKPKAVIRELACNAHDSHVAAGHPERPIEIHLPSTLDLTFYVKDYGTGLTDYEVRGGWLHPVTNEQVSDLDMTMTPEEYIAAGYIRSTGIYNTYFRSTKTKSNDFIGQLGLGSKSPFSYASTFNVEVRKDGKVRLYTCYKNEELKPVITLMSVQDTDEENGVTVSMAVRREDVEKFKSAARTALMYFNPAPDVRGISGFKPYDMVHTVRGDQWRIRQAEYYAGMNGPYVVQGFVAYPLDTDLLVQGGLTGTAAKVAETNIDMYVPIGDVVVAASREALQYDRRTVLNLINSFNNATAEMRKSFQDEFDKCKTLYEACCLNDKFYNTGGDTFKKLYSAMNQDDPFLWEGEPIPGTIKLDMSNLDNVSILRIGQTKRGKKSLNIIGSWSQASSTTIVYELPVQGNMHFIFTDRSTSITAQLREYVDRLPEVDGRKPQLLVVKTINKKDLANAEASRDEIENQLSVEFKHINTLPPASSQLRTGNRSASSSGTKRAKTERYVWNGFLVKKHAWRKDEIRRKFSRSCWAIDEVDLAAGGLYIPMGSYCTARTPARIGMYLDVFFDMAVSQGIIESTAIVGMTDTDLAAAKQAGGKWVDVFDYITAEFKKANDAGKLSGRAVIKEIKDKTTKSIAEFLYPAYKKGKLDSLPAGKLREFMEEYHTLEQSASKMTPEQVQKLSQYANIKLDTSMATDKMVKQWKDIQTRYPMLSMVPWNGNLTYTDENLNHIIEYVTLIDNQIVEQSTEIVDDIPF